MEDADARALCLRAGVTADEMRDDPDYGLLLSMSGVRKLAALAPDKRAAAALVATLSDIAARMRRMGLHVVGGTDMSTDLAQIAEDNA